MDLQSFSVPNVGTRVKRVEDQGTYQRQVNAEYCASKDLRGEAKKRRQRRRPRFLSAKEKICPEE